MRAMIMGLSLPCLLVATTISFDDALNKTFLNNKSLKAKKLSIKEAKSNLAKAKGYNWGKLTFQENIARTNNALNVFGMKLMSREASLGDFGFNTRDFGRLGQMMQNGQEIGNVQPKDLNNPKARTNYETKLVYELPIFTGFKLQNAKTMAKLQVKAQKAKFNHDKKQLGLEVLKAYNGAVAAKYFIDATKKAKKATKSFVYFASSMLKEGLVTKIDVQQAQVYDMKIDSMLLEAKSKYQLAIAYLQFLTNDYSISDVMDFKAIYVEDLPLSKLQQKAISSREDLKWMRQNVETMKKKIDFEKSGNYPMVGAHLEYGYNDNKIHNMNNKHDYYVAAIGLKYNIFNGSETSSNIQQAKISYQKTHEYLKYMTDGIKLEVKKAFLTLKTKRSVEKQKIKAQALAEHVLKKSQQLYKNNLMKMSDLLMQQASAQKARAEMIMAKYEATIAEAQLKLSIGQSLQGEK